MIYTITLNPAIDKTVMIPNFAAGSVNRIQNMRIDAGGKGINVSKCLQSLGMKSKVCAILGGSSGKKIFSLIRDMGLDVLHIPVIGETRTNLKIIDTEKQENTDINEHGPEVSELVLQELRDAIARQLDPGDVVVISGSLPRGVEATLYRDWVDFFNGMGVLVILDADGDPMRQGIQSKPYLIKPNNLEMARLVDQSLTSVEELIAAGMKLKENGIQEVLISRGGDGAIYLAKEGIYYAEGLKVPVLSTVGAGDSMVAAMAFGFEKKMEASDRLRLAIAISAASVTCSGTQPPEREMIKKLYHQVKIWEVN